MPRRVNYDAIAATYNRRFQDGGTRGVAVALTALARELRPERILEVGCGTGRWLADLRAVTDQLYGLDLSGGMLAQARQRDGRMHLICGRAERLPFPAASFDLVYCVNALHHFEGQRDFVREARRLLRPGGALAVVGMNPHGRRDSWYVYHYFDGAYDTDLARFPAWGAVRGWMTEAGFEPITGQTVEHIRRERVGWTVFDDPFLRQDATSQLTLLSDAAYAAGLERIRAALHVAQANAEELVFRSDIVLGMLVGRV